jgi:hypothetical protein
MSRHHPDRFRVGFRGDREPRLDDVHPERPKLVRHLQLLVDTKREAGRLFAIAQGGIEDSQPIAGHLGPSSFPCTSQGMVRPIYSFLDYISNTYAAPGSGGISSSCR